MCSAVQSRAGRQRELVERTLAGCRLAAAQLFDEFRALAYHLARAAADKFHVRGGQVALDEMAGAALAQMMTQLGAYDPTVASVSTWAYWVMWRAAAREGGIQARAGRLSVRMPEFAERYLIAAPDPEHLADVVADDWYGTASVGLTDREKEVIERRFGLCGRAAETWCGIGRALHVTRQCAEQTARRALKKMAAALQAQAA